MKPFVILVVLAAYLGIILFNRKINPLIFVFVGIIILFFRNAITLETAIRSINLNVLGIFLGTMTLSALFIYSRVPEFLAVRFVDKARNVGSALLYICLLSGAISSFTENVATVIIIAPIAFEVAKKLDTDPTPFLIGIAISSNLQGSATMIGDSPSMILAMSHGMNFMDFFWMKGRPGIAFAVEIGAVASFIVLYILFRKLRQPTKKIDSVSIKTWVPSFLIICMIISLALASFVKDRPYYTVSYICIFFGIVGIIWFELFERQRFSFIKYIDWRSFFFLIGIFILIGALSHAGVITDIADYISNLTKGDVLFSFIFIIGISVLFSAFIDNIPFITGMIPVVKIVAQNLVVNQELLLFGLLIGATLGGNLTPIGASANIVAMGMLRERGYKVDFKDFLKIGLPFTITAVISASIFLWVVWR